MALVLSLRVGEDFRAGDQLITISDIAGPCRFEVTVVSSGRKYKVTDEQSVELREIENVFLQAGESPQNNVVRVAVDAPRSIAIVRGDTSRASPREPGFRARPGEATVARVHPRRRFA